MMGTRTIAVGMSFRVMLRSSDVLNAEERRKVSVPAAAAVPLAVPGIDAPVVPLVAPAVAVEAVAVAFEAVAVPIAKIAGLVEAAVVVAVLVSALVFGMAGAVARLVAVARLDLALHVAAPRAARAAVLDALGTPAVGPAAVAGIVPVDVRLPTVARTAIGIGHLVLGVVGADERLVISSAESHG